MREVWKSHAEGVEDSCGRCGSLMMGRGSLMQGQGSLMCGSLAYQTFSCVPDDRKLNLLSNGAVESFWDAVWLGIEPFLCFIWISIDFP